MQFVHPGKLGALGSRRGASASAPLIQVDRVNSVYKVRGVVYASELAALQSLDPNATQSGQVAAVGPVVVTGAPELVVNGDFASGDLAGWSTTQTSGGPATFAYSSGSLLCTVNGATQSRAEQFPPFVCGESYYGKADLTRNGADVAWNIGTEATYAFVPNVATSQQSNGTGTKTSPFVAAVSRSRFGARQNTSGGTSWNLDNASLKLCRPTNAGWQRKHRWRIAATAKVSPTANEWLFALTNNASGAANNYEYLAAYRRSSDGHVILEHQTRVGFPNSSFVAFSVDLGAVAGGASFSIEVQISSRIKASLNGGTLQSMPGSAPANYPIFCIGKAFYAGTTTWTGTIQSYTVDQPASILDNALSIIGVGNSLPWGNSATGNLMGASGNTWHAKLVRDNLAGAAWFNNMARPGATSTQLRNGLVDQSDAAYADYLDRQPFYNDPRTVLIIWAAENDGESTVAIQNTIDIVNKWRSINGPNARFIVVEPLRWGDPGQGGHMTWGNADAITAGYRTAFGVNSFDLKGYVCTPTQGGLSCQGLDDAGIAVGSQQPSDQSDFANLMFPASLRDTAANTVHLNDTGGIPAANAFAQKLSALGYT